MARTESFRQLYIKSSHGHVRKEFYIFLPVKKISKLTGTLCFWKMWFDSITRSFATPGRSAKVRILILEAYGTYIIMYGTVCYFTAARSRQDSWASSAKKIRPLEKKLGRKPSTPQIIWKSAVKKFCYKFLGQFLPIIVKIRPQLWNLEFGRFLGRWLPRPQEILLGRFWVQRPWIRPSGTGVLLSTSNLR